MTDLTRVAELLDDLGTLWAHPGVSAQANKHFVEEAFDEILLDKLGICSITPTESFGPLVALAVVGGFGAGDRIRTGKTHPRSHLDPWTAASVQIQGISTYVALLTA